MSKNNNIFTTTLRLNLNNAQDLEAWNNLMSADDKLPEYSSYSRTIVTALNDHFSRMDRMEDMREWEEGLLQRIEETVQGTFADCMERLQIASMPSVAANNKPPAQLEPPDEMEANIEAFLENF